MECVAKSEEYIASFGWGARGRNLGISRMFGEGDLLSLSRNNWFLSVRPRGLISGFLVILPNHRGIMYIPPIAAKMQPLPIRMRISDSLMHEGAVFSAYFTRDKPRHLILEDILIWKGFSLWYSKTFEERWNIYMKMFVTQNFISDPVLQNYVIELATYSSLQSFSELTTEKNVIEFIPNAPGQKRLILIPSVLSSLPPSSSKTIAAYFAKKETGPDVYSIYKNEERLGIALVRTLAVSRALRNTTQELIPIQTQYNSTFEKWEICGVLEK